MWGAGPRPLPSLMARPGEAADVPVTRATDTRDAGVREGPRQKCDRRRRLRGIASLVPAEDPALSARQPDDRSGDRAGGVGADLRRYRQQLPHLLQPLAD